MSSAGAWNLHFIEGKNGHTYLNILRSNLKRSAKKLGFQDTFKFYPDPKICVLCCPKLAAVHAQLQGNW